MTLTIPTKQTEKKKDIDDKKDAASRRIPVNRITF